MEASYGGWLTYSAAFSAALTDMLFEEGASSLYLGKFELFERT